MNPSPHSSVESLPDLRTGGRWFEPSARSIFFPRIGDSHFNRIHTSLTAVHCFNNDYVGKQPWTWKEYCAEYWLKQLQESLNRCTDCHKYN